jgi:hypothetical protein
MVKTIKTGLRYKKHKYEELTFIPHQVKLLHPKDGEVSHFVKPDPSHEEHSGFTAGEKRTAGHNKITKKVSIVVFSILTRRGLVRCY